MVNTGYYSVEDMQRWVYEYDIQKAHQFTNRKDLIDWFNSLNWDERSDINLRHLTRIIKYWKVVEVV